MAYLLKNRHGTYYLRIVLSNEQRQALGKREIRKSLGTKSIREANKLLPECYMNTLASLEGIAAKTGPKLSELVKEYLEHQKRVGVQPKTLWEKENACYLLSLIISDKAIEAYTKEDVRLFRNTVVKLPPRFNKLILDKGWSIKKILKENDGKKTLTVTSYNNYIRALNAIFNFALNEGYTTNNPFKAARIQQKVKASSFKDIFTPEDIILFFDHVESIDGLRSDRYWLSYLLFYTGARLNELCQLTKEDIYQVDGLWCIHVRALKPYQRIKNLSSERVIPIHSKVIQKGFLSYVDSVEHERIFPMLRYREKYGFSSQPSQWFSAVIKELGIQGKVSSNSFRHLVATKLKNHGVDVSLAAALLGHSTNTMTYDRYGKSIDPSVLKPIVELL